MVSYTLQIVIFFCLSLKRKIQISLSQAGYYITHPSLFVTFLYFIFKAEKNALLILCLKNFYYFLFLTYLTINYELGFSHKKEKVMSDGLSFVIIYF